MTTQRNDTTPRTAAGRDLLTNGHWDAEEERLLLPGYVGLDDLRTDILAIEAEAAEPAPLDALTVLREVAGSGIEWTNAGRYHTVQIDVHTWEEVQRLAAGDKGSDR